MHNASLPSPAAAPQIQAALQQLAKLLGQKGLLTATEDLVPYECDALTAYRQLPRAVALPRNEAQVIDILKICREHRLPVVARGAGTGLAGGALPDSGGLLLSLARLHQTLRIDPAARQAVVSPGVTNLAISRAAEPFGLYYAPDPSSQLACTIGGNVAANAGGVHCLKYGLTLHNLLRVRALTIEGEVLEIGSHALDAPGLDLLPLITGSEGLLAVITEVTVKLIPKARHAQCILAAFESVTAAADAVANIIAAGLLPAGLEMMDQAATQAVEHFIHAGYPLDAAAILLCESDGTPEQVAEEIVELSALLQQAGARALRVSQSEQERLTFWAGRKAAFPAAGRIAADYYCIDATIPRKRLGEMLTAIAQMEQHYGLRCINVFHAGDGNLHPLILFDASVPGELQRTEAFGEAILKHAVALGGTITGEHGVGFEKLNAMCVQFSRDELAVFHAIKHAFDEAGLLNPGKAVPSLHRCAELGGMHVHRGELPHPDLPRF